MNTTVKSLQDVYVSMGGQLTDTYEDIAGGIPVGDYNTIPDVIAALAHIAGSTIELPGVSEADNGDVLTVIGGKWGKAAPVSNDDLKNVQEIQTSNFVNPTEWSELVADYEYNEDYTYLGQVHTATSGELATRPLLLLEVEGNITDLRFEFSTPNVAYTHIIGWFKEVSQSATAKCFKNVDGNYLYNGELDGGKRTYIIDLIKSGFPQQFVNSINAIDIHAGGQGNPAGSFSILKAELLPNYSDYKIFVHNDGAMSSVIPADFIGKEGLHFFPNGVEMYCCANYYDERTQDKRFKQIANPSWIIVRKVNNIYPGVFVEGIALALSTQGGIFEFTFRENSVESSTSKLLSLPSYSSADANKFLRINAQGAAIWESVPSAESEVY